MKYFYLDCSDDVFIKRYKMTRRNHPLSKNIQIPEGIKMERKILEPLREKLYNRYNKYEA